MTVKSRVEKLEQARPSGGRARRGERFAIALSRAYGDGEPIEPISDEDFERAMKEAYGPDYRAPTTEV